MYIQYSNYTNNTIKTLPLSPISPVKQEINQAEIGDPIAPLVLPFTSST